MAKALQCPNCGTKKRLDGLATDTFQCEQCGQVLKVPPAARPSAPRAAPAPPRTAGSAAAPPPRRAAPPEPASPPPEPPPRPAAPTPTVAAAPPPRPAAPSPTMAAAPPPPGRNPTPVLPVDGGARRPAGAPPRGAGKPPRDSLPLAIRIGAWLLAIPVGLALIGIPARVLGYLTSQKLLDVIVKHNLSRFVPLLVIVVLWALATTVLVEIFIEGGRWLMLRRRRRGGPDRGPGGYDPAPVPVAPPPRRARSRPPAGAARGS